MKESVYAHVSHLHLQQLHLHLCTRHLHLPAPATAPAPTLAHEELAPTLRPPATLQCTCTWLHLQPRVQLRLHLHMRKPHQQLHCAAPSCTRDYLQLHYASNP